MKTWSFYISIYYFGFLALSAFYSDYALPSDLDRSNSVDCLQVKQELELVVCNESSLHLGSALNNSRESFAFGYGQFYGAAHFKQIISVHSKFEATSILQQKAKRDLERRLELLTLNAGKTPFNFVEASIGVQALPFGLNLPQPPGILTRENPKHFWIDPTKALKVIVDNKKNLSLEVGLKASESDPTYSIRLSYDSSVWMGSRFLISAAKHKPKTHMLGAAFYSQHQSRGLMQLEWVRISNTEQGLFSLDHQFFRLGIVGTSYKGIQPYFNYDDVKYTHRLVSIGQRYLVNPTMSFDISLAYKKDETGEKRHLWYFNNSFRLSF